MSNLSIKDFKLIIKEYILEKLNEIGYEDLNKNNVKTGYFFF